MLCNDDLRRRIQANLAAFQPRLAGNEDIRRAAVAVTVSDAGYGADLPGLPHHEVWDGMAALLLTRRSALLRSHPGQWALPGGTLDPGESIVDTALREMHEEICVSLPESAVLGRLDDFVTRSGFVMSPVVVWGGPHLETRPNPAEVASVHRIPISEFLREDAPQLEPAGDAAAPILRMPVGTEFIAAPTAAILYQFREVCLLGRPTRVGHYEQPHFAWN